MSRHAIRPDDHTNKGRLVVFELENQDVAIQVIDDNGGFAAIRFREPMVGGGISPNTFQALKDLLEAMEKDNNENPIRGS